MRVGRTLLWLALAGWAICGMVAPLSTISTLFVAVAAIAFVALILYGVHENVPAADAAVVAICWPLGEANRRGLLLLGLGLVCVVMAWHAPWGESLFASDIRTSYELFNELAAKYGWASRAPVVEEAPVVTKWWWFTWAMTYFVAFGLYLPLALRDNLQRGVENFRRKKAELDERMRAEAARHAGDAGGESSTHGLGHRWGAIMGTAFLALEFLGDVFLHGGFTRS